MCAQSCLTLCNPMDYSPRAASVHVFQATVLEWVVVSSRGFSQHRDQTHSLMCVYVQLLSLVYLFVTPWTVTCHSPLSMEFSRQEYWSELPFPPPGDLPESGIEPTTLTSHALAGRFFTAEPAGKPYSLIGYRYSYFTYTY